MSEVKNWNTLSKTSVTSSEYIPVTGKLRFQLQTLFPSLATAGTGSESLFSSITNKNQLNFKGIKSGDTGLLTVTTVSDNIVLTALEAGIDLSLCNNAVSNFISTVALASNVSGILSVVNGGTGLNTIAKGAMLYASAANTLAATAPMSTNGQLLIGNTTNGYPSVATLTAGSGMTITNGAGTITLAAAFSSAAAVIDMNTYNINLDAAAGQSWVSGDGANEGMTVDANGLATFGDSTPTTVTATGQISLQGTTATAIEIGNTNTYKDYTIKCRNAAGGVHGAGLTLDGANATSGNTNGGAIVIDGGASSGTGIAGSVTLTAGDPGAGGTEGTINLNTHGAGAAESTAFLINSTHAALYKPLLYKGVQTLTGAGAVDVTNPITHIVTTGVNALTLADGETGQVKMIVMKTDGGNGTLTPANFAQGTTITFDAVGDSVSLLFTNAAWHSMGGHGTAIA